MGGGGQANSKQADQAAKQQSAASAQDMALSKQNMDFQNRLMTTLFGTGKTGSTGSLTNFLDPNQITQTDFNPAYKAQWNQNQNEIARDFSNQRGSLARSFANMGATSRSTPNGFQADQMGKLSRDEADARGETFAGLKGAQYKDALSNFWNANNIASGNAASTGSNALQGSGQSGTSSAQLYGTAGQWHPGTMGNVVGSGLGAGGAVGAAAFCPAEGSLILMFDNSRKLLEHIRKGDLVKGIDGKPDEVLEDPMPSLQICCEIVTAKCTTRVSTSHTFVRHAGGYTFAGNSLGQVLDTDHGPAPVLTIGTLAEKIFCRHLLLKRSHGYNNDGIWSLE